jgi:hypothetical protein
VPVNQDAVAGHALNILQRRMSVMHSSYIPNIADLSAERWILDMGSLAGPQAGQRSITQVQAPSERFGERTHATQNASVTVINTLQSRTRTWRARHVNHRRPSHGFQFP